MTTIEQHVFSRIRAEYLEMPGLTLTALQVQRLCGVEAPPCLTALNALVESNFLWVKTDGTYTRVTETTAPRLHLAKAQLKLPVRAAFKL